MSHNKNQEVENILQTNCEQEFCVEYADNGIILASRKSDFCEVVEFKNENEHLDTSRKAHRAIGKQLAEMVENDMKTRQFEGLPLPIGYTIKIEIEPFFKNVKK